jgi:transposase
MKEKGVVLKQNVGIDVSMTDFKVCFSEYDSSIQVRIQGSMRFQNTEKGFQELEAWIDPKRKNDLSLHVTMEATGVYYERLAYYLYDKGYKVHVIIPNRTKSYARGLGVESKTDKLDAKTLGRMGLERDLRVWEPTSPVLLELKQLTRERDALVIERTMVSNQLHAYTHQGKPNQASIGRTKKLKSFINEQIKEIEKSIRAKVNKDKVLSKKMGYIQSIPGIGFLTAVIVVAETNGFASFTNGKQLTSYAGLDIKISESGKWKGQSKISKKGNKYLRKSLYMPSLSKIKYDAKTNQFYEKLKARKGNGMVANVAVQRKLLVLMRTLWIKEEMYSETSELTLEDIPSTVLALEDIPETKKLRKTKTPAKRDKLGSTSKEVLPTKKLRKSKTPAIQDKLTDNVT